MNHGRCSCQRNTIIRGILLGLLAQLPAAAHAKVTRPVQSARDSAQQAFFAVPSGGSRSAGKVAVKVSGRDTHGAVAIVETPTLAGYGPPLHRHHVENEWFYALEGEYDVQVGGSLFHIKPGGSVFCPRMMPHTWRDVGSASGKLIIMAQPAGHIVERPAPGHRARSKHPSAARGLVDRRVLVLGDTAVCERRVGEKSSIRGIRCRIVRQEGVGLVPDDAPHDVSVIEILDGLVDRGHEVFGGTDVVDCNLRGGAYWVDGGRH